ncbi:MAG: acetate--CoA ligase family protein [Burkholderiales bacterium]|nr:acetate--CoA ligase family protein [Burkholderiales bacterium]
MSSDRNERAAAYWPRSRLAAIDRMLKPRSIAVVGATPRGGYGGRLLGAVLRAKDRVRVYPVNPNYPEIMGMKAWASVAALPEAPDLVGVVVPHRQVLPVLEECRRKGAGAAVIISAGFAERGNDAGNEMQSRLAEFARESGLHFTGPNCLGIANVRDDIWPTASSRTLGGLTGHVGLVCQSGATAFGPFLLRAVDSGIGLSCIVSTGNEVDLDFTDFARYLVDDPGTRVIAGFVEGFKDVTKLVAVAELAAERGKPIVLIKIGRSECGAQAARSHTAALTGVDANHDALFRQYGIIRVQGYEDLLEVSHLLASHRRPARPGIAVVSHSGGISSLTADLLGQAGLTLPPLSEHARGGIKAILGDFGWAANPADVTGFAHSDSFPAIMDCMIEEPAVGTLVVASAGTGDQVEQVVRLRDRSEKGIAFFWTTSRGDTKTLPRLKASGIPIFYSPEKLATGLKSLFDYHAWRERWLAAGAPALPEPTAEQERRLESARGAGRTVLSEAEAKRLLAAWGVPVTREIAAATAPAAVEAAAKLGYPVALKIDSPDILHKTEARAVRLGLKSAPEVAAACDEVMANARAYRADARIEGVLVQEMVAGGVETIVGIQYDPQVGPMLLFGTGGVMVEVYNDVALRRCPVTRSGALEMIAEVRGAKLLRGFRGEPPADIDALADALERASYLAVHAAGTLAELDVNPLVVLPAGQGVKAVDALAVLALPR